MNILGIILIAGALLQFLIKVLVAYSRCSGGAPLLDGVIFPPLLLGFGSAALFRHYGISASGLIVGLVSMMVMGSAYAIAWQLGARRGR